VQIVAFNEFADGGSHLLEVSEDPAVDHLLLEGSVEPLRNSVRFRFLHEPEARRDPPEADLLLEVIRQALAAVIHPKRQPARHLGLDRTENPLQALGDRLERGKAAPDLAHVSSYALRVPVLDGREDPHPAVVQREHPCAVCPRHHVRRERNDLTVVRVRGALAYPVGREQLVLSHDPQHAFASHPNAVQDA